MIIEMKRQISDAVFDELVVFINGKGDVCDGFMQPWGDGTVSFIIEQPNEGYTLDYVVEFVQNTLNEFFGEPVEIEIEK